MNVLHVFPDEKFFDGVSNTFDKVEGITNHYIFYTPDRNYKFKFIRSQQKIRIETNKKEYYKCFSDKSIDVIFFHSLSNYYYELVLKADSKKVIIWWSWGYDLYQTNLINLELFKPLTKKSIKTLNKVGLNINESIITRVIKHLRIKNLLRRNTKIRSKVISRINYFIPVFPIEYDLIKENNFFNAQLFMERGVFRDFDESLLSHEVPSSDGNILLGNSATFTNNHIDIIELLKYLKIQNRKIIVPLSYGEKKYSEFIKTKVDDRYQILENFLMFSEYEKLISSCSYALSGAIRQQSIGNINMCLLKGIKVFLYSNSLIYKQLKRDGYIVFSIDEDLNEKELTTPLSYNDMIHNQNIFRLISEKNGLKKLNESFDKIAKQIAD